MPCRAPLLPQSTSAFLGGLGFVVSLLSPDMNDQGPNPEKLRVIVAGGGVAALETTLALAKLAPDHTDVTVIAPNADFAYRPLAVREPFAYGPASSYPLARIVEGAGATLVVGELGWVDPGTRTIHTTDDKTFEYDALMLALGAQIVPRYTHALTIDDRHLDETLHGVIQDIEGDYLHRLAFVVPDRLAWPLPLYEIALMTAARAYDTSIELDITIVTPEESPLAIFGPAATGAASELLQRAKITTITSAHAEVPSAREVLINGKRQLEVDRVIALPELYGPSVGGIPLGENGFIPVDAHGRVREVEHVFAAGDATDFPVKHGGVGSQQADAAAESIAAVAGAAVTPEPFHPIIHGMLLTGGDPRYLTARITGGRGFSSEITDAPTWSPPGKVASKYLAPRIEQYDREQASTR
jgi:sulfide:quinone oxidoreductase